MIDYASLLEENEEFKVAQHQKAMKKYDGRNTLYKIYKVVVTRSWLHVVDYWGDTWAIFPSSLIKRHELWRRPYDVDWETVSGILIEEKKAVGYLYIPTVVEGVEYGRE